MRPELPAWRDPRHLTPLRVRQLEAHEQAIRDEERALAQRRVLPVVSEPEPVEDPDFPGCVW